MEDSIVQKQINNAVTAFPSDVLTQMDLGNGRKYYVYILYDPRTMRPFYVGKGCDNRAFDHARNVKKLLADLQKAGHSGDDQFSLKEKQIMEIIQSGHEVIVMILRWGLSEKTAFEVEAAAIDLLLPLLTNSQSGHNPDRGLVRAEDLIKALGAPVYAEPSFRYVIIKTRQDWIYQRGSLYDSVSHAWHRSLNSIKKYPYVLAVVDGIVCEVYKVTRWYTDPYEPPRVAFDGVPATDPEARALKGKRIPDYYRKKGQASPVLYSRIIQ